MNEYQRGRAVGNRLGAVVPLFMFAYKFKGGVALGSWAMSEPASRAELVLFTTEDGSAQFFLRAGDGSVWLS